MSQSPCDCCVISMLSSCEHCDIATRYQCFCRQKSLLFPLCCPFCRQFFLLPTVLAESLRLKATHSPYFFWNHNVTFSVPFVTYCIFFSKIFWRFQFFSLTLSPDLVGPLVGWVGFLVAEAASASEAFLPLYMMVWRAFGQQCLRVIQEKGRS